MNWLPLLSTFVLFALSLGGAVVLFKWLTSFAAIRGTVWEAGGAIAGFIIIYVLLYQSLLRLQTPYLTGIQTMGVIQLYQESLAGQLLLMTFSLIDDIDEEKPIPSREDFKNSVIGIRDRTRQVLSLFDTPLGDINEYLRNVIDEQTLFWDENITKARDIIESNLSSSLKRRRLIDLAQSQTSIARARYLADLKRKE
ncbi:MAG: hypothetical protein ACE5JO_00420 [Candidatus Binatia bacterium]